MADTLPAHTKIGQSSWHDEVPRTVISPVHDNQKANVPAEMHMHPQQKVQAVTWTTPDNVVSMGVEQLLNSAQHSPPCSFPRRKALTRWSHLAQGGRLEGSGMVGLGGTLLRAVGDACTTHIRKLPGSLQTEMQLHTTFQHSIMTLWSGLQ